ncbi:hypothetical protein JL722_4723 [Aureococcus anophagefferens]|nr:hypothetical protein JL722_4723 [Aureococcus anophagefferens]
MSRRLALLACVAAAGAAPDNADVAAYVRGLGAVVPHCSPVSQGTCIYVDGAGGIVHARDMYRTKVAGKGKQMLMDMMLRGAVEALAAGGAALPGRWTSFNMVYSRGPAKRPFPTLAIGKREPHRPGLLIPNPFFVSPAWWADHAARTLGARRRALPRAGQRALPLVLRARRRRAPRAAARRGGPRGPARRRLHGRRRLPSLGACVAALEAKTGLAAPRGANVSAAHVAQANYSAYKYLIHMPGSATGSYSRNLQYLWTHGSVVLVWNHTATEWYYGALVDGVHYVSVDAATLGDKLADLERDPALRARLVRGARRFFDDHLAAPVLVDRWRAVLDALGAAQDRGDPAIPESACTCDARLAATYAACDQCDVTRLGPADVAHHVGIAKRARPPRVAPLGGA